jgi:uncharacterized protein (TIGR03435 family)
MKPLVLVLLAMPAFCQPEFTVASMKLTEILPDKRPIVMIDPGRVNLTGLTLQMLIARAHGVKEYQVRGADSVLHERYTILATMPPDTADPVVWQMLRKLLEDRLELKLRRGQEEMPVYTLVQAKNGNKLKPAAGGPMSVRYTGGAFVGKNASMENLSNLLSGFLDRPVVDQTGVDGTYDFSLAFTPDASLGIGMMKMSKELEYSGAESHGGSIFTALQEQLGLKLDGRKMPVDVLVVESARSVPVEN